jgi:hypothetical protein
MTRSHSRWRGRIVLGRPGSLFYEVRDLVTCLLLMSSSCRDIPTSVRIGNAPRSAKSVVVTEQGMQRFRALFE